MTNSYRKELRAHTIVSDIPSTANIRSHLEWNLGDSGERVMSL